MNTAHNYVFSLGYKFLSKFCFFCRKYSILKLHKLMSLNFSVLKGNQYVFYCSREFHITVFVCALWPNIRASTITSPVADCIILKETKSIFTGSFMVYLQFVQEFSFIRFILSCFSISVREFKKKVPLTKQGNWKGILFVVFVVPKCFTEHKGCKHSCHGTQVRMALFVYILPLTSLI
jgi:hypothetical protein